MKRRALLCIIALILFCLGLSGCGGGSRQAEQPVKQAQVMEDSIADLLKKREKITAFSYDYVMTSSSGSITGKLWVDGDKVRSDTVVNNLKTITILDEHNLYIYQPDQGQAMKMPVNQDHKDIPGVYDEEMDVGKVKVLETVTYDGALCKVVSVVEDKQESKVWLRVSDGFLMKTEFTGDDGSKMVMECKNVKIGSVPAEVFRLPAGVQIADMANFQPKQ